jgi:hypothetical protein
MKDYWLKFGCFLTGYNYNLVKNSSEASAQSVKKYLSALIIVSILWSFIGFSFSQRYLHSGVFGSICVAIAMLIVIIQLERQIILMLGRSNWAIIFRSVIVVVMAIIGSIIIDQIIFKEDIERQKISDVQAEVNNILIVKTIQLDAEIESLDSLIDKKEKERNRLIDDVTRKPFVKGSSSQRKSYIIKVLGANGFLKDSVITKTDLALTDIVNPKVDLIQTIDKQIGFLRIEQSEKQKSRINIRSDLENELKSKKGFLDELKTLISILTTNISALIVWILVFLFFLSLEFFVLVIKFGDDKNDYERTIMLQMEMRIKIIDGLSDPEKDAVKNSKNH